MKNKKVIQPSPKKQLPPLKKGLSNLLAGDSERTFDRLSKKFNTPKKVQDFLRSYLAYNAELECETQSSAWVALQRGTAHCLEASLIAAAVLERRGYPPLLLSFESKDSLDHVLYLFKHNSRWGTIGRSRDKMLHGRAPIFRSVRDLVFSYVDEYVDQTGRITGFQVADLREITEQTGVDWRKSKKNLWALEQYLIDLKHTPLKTSERRYQAAKARFLRDGCQPTKKYWW